MQRCRFVLPTPDEDVEGKCNGDKPANELEPEREFFHAKMSPTSSRSSPSEPASIKTSYFVEKFLSEIERIDNFVCSRMDELEEQLQLSLEKAQLHGKMSYLEDKSTLKRSVRKRKKNSELQVLGAYISLYQKIKEVENFSFLNTLLCIKLCKKHDRVCKRCVQPVYPEIMNTAVYATCFGQCRTPGGRINQFKEDVQHACAEYCCNGDVMEAKGKLVMYKGGVDRVDLWSMGYTAGLSVMLLLWFIWEAVVEPGQGQTMWNDPAIYLYSFIGNLLVYNWLWAVDVYAWEKANINYFLILDITADHSPPSHEYFKRACPPTMIFLANLILYYKARRRTLYINISPSIFPVSLALLVVAYYLYKAIQDRNVVHYRLYSPTVLLHIVTGPFARVSFREVVLADVLTSMVKVYSNCAYAACYLITGSYSDQTSTLHAFGTCNGNYMFAITATLTILPLWFRFAQCVRKVYDVSSPGNGRVHWCLRLFVWPHSFNALKYVLSIIVVLFSLGSNANAYRVIYILLLVVSTLYSYWWDIYMDFGLLRIIPTSADVYYFFSGKWSRVPRRLFLRPLLMYKHAVYRYYVAMALDLIMRAAWTLSLIPQVSMGCGIIMV